MKKGITFIKWCIAVIFLIIFIHYVNVAILYMQTSMENIAPPDDYLKGDSWDMEQQMKKLDSGTPPPPGLLAPNAPMQPPQGAPNGFSPPPDTLTE